VAQLLFTWTPTIYNDMVSYYNARES